MLIAKMIPDWETKTLLCRFMEQNGIETAFILTERAIKSFEICEEDRIYDMVIPGGCVRLRKGPSKYGVFGLIEVHARVACKVRLSQIVWPAVPSYDFVDWGLLQQKQNGDFIDIIGRVLENPVVDPTSSLQKKCVTLSNGTQVLTVAFLGGHSQKIVHKDDIVIIRSAVIKEYCQARNAQTVYLSAIQINPLPSAGVPIVPVVDDGQPKQKALRMSPQMEFTVAQLKTIMSNMERDAGATEESEMEFATTKKENPQNICVRACLKQLNRSFFAKDVPIVVFKDGTETACLVGTLIDATGEVEVKLWEKAVYSVCGATTPKLKELWEKGVENDIVHNDILQNLNKNNDKNFLFIGAVKIAILGSKKACHKAQVNINWAELA